MANMVGQIGCMTSVASFFIIGVAFGLGYLLDQWLGLERPIFMLLALLASFPVTLYVIVRVSLMALGRAQRAQERALKQEQDQATQEDRT